MSDGDDFQWLYTRRVNAQPPKPPTTPPPATPGQNGPHQGDDAERTQVLPVQPALENTAERPAAAPGRTTVPSRDSAPPPIIAPLPKGALPGSERPRIKRPIKITIISILVLLIVWAGSIVWAGLSVWNHVHRVNYIPSGSRPAEQPGTTYLMVGSDSRDGLTPAQEAEYATGGSAGIAHTDTMMLIHTGSNGTVLISIPRDSIVNIPVQFATNIGQNVGTAYCFNPPTSGAVGVCSKINAAYGDGAYDANGYQIKNLQARENGEAQAVVKTVEQATGIRIDGIVVIGLAGLPQMVDAVGGITICPIKDLHDADSGAYMKKGCQPANGKKALAFARDRHDFSAEGEDLQRAADQRQVVAAVVHKLEGLSFLLNPFKLNSSGKKVVESFQLGQGMSLWQTYSLFSAMKALSSGKAKSCAVPNNAVSTSSLSAVEWDPVKAPQLFKLIANDQVQKIGPNLCSPTGR